jgi:hypothetical protein
VTKNLYKSRIYAYNIKKDDYLLKLSAYAAKVRVRVMVFNATFNNISVISWRSVLLV